MSFKVVQNKELVRGGGGVASLNHYRLAEQESRIDTEVQMNDCRKPPQNSAPMKDILLSPFSNLETLWNVNIWKCTDDHPWTSKFQL